MRELTDYERGFLRAIEKKGGELVMRGKHAHHKWDYLVEAGYLHRRSNPTALDTVVYVLTEKGSAALAK
jgi:DNA-binding MarR family transcriptional regulator